MPLEPASDINTGILQQAIASSASPTWGSDTFSGRTSVVNWILLIVVIATFQGVWRRTETAICRKLLKQIDRIQIWSVGVWFEQEWQHRPQDSLVYRHSLVRHRCGRTCPPTMSILWTKYRWTMRLVPQRQAFKETQYWVLDEMVWFCVSSRMLADPMFYMYGLLLCFFLSCSLWLPSLLWVLCHCCAGSVPI